MSTPLTNDARLTELRSRLDGLLPRDQHRLRRRIDGARKAGDADKIIEAIAADVVAAEQRPARRRASVPKITYPEELPVSQRKDDILAAIRDHQVVIVAGETGSGKTTQLPKICLELGRGVTRTDRAHPAAADRRPYGRRAHRRGAGHVDSARPSATRSASPTRSGDDTLVKLMTDGILLAEIQQDRLLRQYDTLIIDEAHERSLNIDFLLGYLKQLLPRRPDLKVIITSATIDPERFSRHFGDAADRRGLRADLPGRGPLPARSCRRERRVDDAADGRGEPRDQIDAIVDAVDELRAEGPGDVLVFLCGEREIRDTADALNRARTCPTPRSSRCTRGCRPPSSTGSSSRTPAAGSCSRPTSPRPR